MFARRIYVGMCVERGIWGADGTVCVRACVCVCVCACACVCMSMCVYLYTYTSVCVRAYVQIHILHVHTHTHTHVRQVYSQTQQISTQTHTQTHIHTHSSGLQPDAANKCKQFLRHKGTIISPSHLTAAGIPVTRVLQKPGEFVITMPYAYHRCEQPYIYTYTPYIYIYIYIYNSTHHTHKNKSKCTYPCAHIRGKKRHGYVSMRVLCVYVCQFKFFVLYL
jgi:hypothetical protein